LGLEGFYVSFEISKRRAGTAAKEYQMAGGTQTYPWFDVPEGDDIEQGDIFEQFPVFLLPTNLPVASNTNDPVKVEIDWGTHDVIVMSQSCDLRKGDKAIDAVILCAVWKRSQVPEFTKDDWMENARKGRFPAYHVLNECNLATYQSEFRIVDFRKVYSMPLDFVRGRVQANKRVRLLPPYREHLSQSFARFFMRVGLPSDIPPFKGKKK
jgi:hypothetical protein